jgi:hypothetical protein
MAVSPWPPRKTTVGLDDDLEDLRRRDRMPLILGFVEDPEQRGTEGFDGFENGAGHRGCIAGVGGPVNTPRSKVSVG